MLATEALSEFQAMTIDNSINRASIVASSNPGFSLGNDQLSHLRHPVWGSPSNTLFHFFYNIHETSRTKGISNGVLMVVFICFNYPAN
jgi:hypothetical protein